MKTRRFFLLYSATVLCWLPFIEVAAENLSDSSLKDLKQEEISDSKVEQYDNDVENNEKSPLIRQKQLIKSNSNNKSNSYFALNQLTENSIIVTSESLDAIERDAESALVRVDIYEGANLPIAISKSLEKLFSEKEERYTDLISVINSNKKLFSSITELRDALDNLSLYDHMDFDNEKYSEAYGTVLTAFSDVIAEIFKDEKVQSVNYFVDFITLSKKFTDLAFVRYHTEKMLSKIRSTLEGISGIKTNVNATLSVNVPVPIPNMSVNLDLFTNGEAYGSSSTSFYTITKTKGAKAGVTFNIAPLKISGKLSLERAASTLFYSLEAYMDYINETHVPSLNKLKAFSIKGMNDSLKERKNLQEKEKDVLANNGMFERYLRMFGAMPNVGASLIWIDITKAKAKDKATETTISEEISANVSVPLSSIGLTLKASQGLK
ncbi:MAG: hypothetical protein IJ730_00485, partial [Alphaproteobacteria bacterium]|nr:hypothetical protein [Alphaproteobacteria bacterium]